MQMNKNFIYFFLFYILYKRENFTYQFDKKIDGLF
jgi:hypothetical protein